MDTTNVFAQLFISNVLAKRNPGDLQLNVMNASPLDRIACYRTLVNVNGLRETTESFMRLLVEMKGDANMKRQMWDEFSMAMP